MTWLSIGCLVPVMAACGSQVGAPAASPSDATAAAAAPVTPSTVAPAADELSVVCDGSSTRVVAGTVAAGEQGVRVRVTGPGAGAGLYLAYSWGGQLRGGDPVPEDEPLVLVIPPGQAEIACQGSGQDPVDPRPVLVTDPTGLYEHKGELRDELDCTNPGVASSPLSGKGSTAVEAVTDFAEKVEAVVGNRDGGYPDQSPQEFLLLEDGRAVGSAQAFRDEAGAWSAAWNYVCTD